MEVGAEQFLASVYILHLYKLHWLYILDWNWELEKMVRHVIANTGRAVLVLVNFQNEEIQSI